MDLSNSQLLLKRNVIVKAVVTPRWKEEVQQQLQAQINQLDGQLQQIEMQANRAMADLQKQSSGTQLQQQTESLQAQVNNQQRKLLDQKNQILQNLQQVQTLELETEVTQTQVDSFFTIERGENLIKKMQVEILLRDGIVEEIRGDL
jgi:Skp family chaperone for outer membrane proteins